MRRMAPLVAALGLALLATTETALAQFPEATRHRAFVGGSVGIAVPVGEFENFVDAGLGFGGFFLYNFDRRGLLGLRVDASYIVYGRETRRRPFSETIQLIQLDVTTENGIAWLSLGPQVTFQAGRVAPYLDGGIGFSYFATRSSVRGSSNTETFASTTNFDDFTFALHSGGGLWILLASGRNPVNLDFGVRYIRNGRVRYLREGSIQEASDGSISFTPIESETNLMWIQVGIAIGVG